MASSQVPSTLRPQGQPGTLAVTTTDIHQGDYFVEILGATAVCTLIAFLAPSLGGSAYLSWLGEIVLVPLSLARAWQRVKWSAVKVPESGYTFFVKGQYRSGHTSLRQPEDALVGLTEDSLCFSTVSGQLESIHFMEIDLPLTKTKEQRTDWVATVLGGGILAWLARPLFWVRVVFSGPAKRDVYVLNVRYNLSSGMAGMLCFRVGDEGKADEVINTITSDVNKYHTRVKAGLRPGRSDWGWFNG